jgi:predicted acylesterase/phospholipase RssA
MESHNAELRQKPLLTAYIFELIQKHFPHDPLHPKLKGSLMPYNKLFPLAILFLGSLMSVTACRSHIETMPALEGNYEYESGVSRDLLIGIALSGGGSRAALFGAAGLEALAKVPLPGRNRSVLEETSYISSVSGGSLAASYYVAKKPLRDEAMLGQRGGLSSRYQDFFDEYIKTMAGDLEWPIIFRQLTAFRWLNSSSRARSLADVLADSFLMKSENLRLTLNDLYEKEKQEHVPRLILNTTVYNSGRRFLVTTVPQREFDFSLVRLLRDSGQVHSAALPASVVASEYVLTPATFDDPQLRIDPRGLPIASAVAASASFPFLIGPMTVQIEHRNNYFHVGDGGLFDNQGTESLAQLFLKKLEEGSAKRALIIVLDSSFPFTARNSTLDRLKNGFKLFIDDPARVTGIMEQRANAYQAMLWHLLQSNDKSIFKNIKVVVVRHTDLEWQGAIPESCQGKLNPDGPVQHLAMIPTRFSIQTDCDRDLLVRAAALALGKKQPDIINFLKER